MTLKTCALVEQLQNLDDPRRTTRNRKHRLVDILVSAFCAIVANNDTFVEIAEWARHHEDFLRTFLELPNGIPSHDTYTRVFALVRPQTLQQVLIAWLQQRRGLPGQWVHLDGKTMRGTRCRAKGLGALHLVNAWASENGLMLGQVAVAAKSNEITAIPQLLELLDLRDKIVTLDAAGCQKNIARQIVAAQGDYVLAVKDNQPTLHAEVRQAFEMALENDSPKLRCHEEEECGHGRREQRVVWVLPASQKVGALSSWTGLATLVMVLRVVTPASTGVESIETSYFISSLRPCARRLAAVIRGHWNIENGLHWVLDVVFREDGRRVYERAAAENVGLLHRIALSLLRGDARKDSLRVKRKRASWSVAYLAELLGIPSI
jgi:predicted transposase YbfD/YdcC